MKAWVLTCLKRFSAPGGLGSDISVVKHQTVTTRWRSLKPKFMNLIEKKTHKHGREGEFWGGRWRRGCSLHKLFSVCEGKQTGGFLQVESYFRASDHSESLLLNI